MTRDRDYALSVGISDLERMTMLGEIYMPYCAEFLIENQAFLDEHHLKSKLLINHTNMTEHNHFYGINI